MEVVQERRENWRVKVTEKPGSLVEQMMTGEVHGRKKASGKTQKVMLRRVPKWKLEYK